VIHSNVYICLSPPPFASSFEPNLNVWASRRNHG